MFVGYTDQGETINLLHYTRKSLNSLHYKEWYCPACKSPLVLKKGQTVRPHFAHKSNQHCQSFSEGETAEHLHGKVLLSKWCEQVGVEYELEAYLPHLQQRPDILINKKIAIEFQCSSLSWVRFMERTENYTQHGFRVIWIFGHKLFVGEKLRDIQRSAICYEPKLGYYLWQLNVEKEVLTCCYHIEELLIRGDICYSKRLFGRAKTIMSALLFPEKMAIQIESRVYQVDTMLTKMKEQLQYQLLRHKPTIMTIQERLYQEGANLNGLSDDFFKPLTQSLILKDSVIIWRFYFWRSCLLNEGQSCDAVWNYFKLSCQKNNLASYQLPLVSVEYVWLQFRKELFKSFQRSHRIKLINNKVVVLKRASQDKMNAGPTNIIKEQSRTSYQISSLPQGDMLL